MNISLQREIELTSQFVEAWFAEAGFVAPMWQIIDGDGLRALCPMPDGTGDKDRLFAAMRALLKQMRATRYIFVCEAWTVEFTPEQLNEARAIDSCEQHPRRIEVVQILSEDAEEGELVATRRIIRTAVGKPTLGPLEIHTATFVEGRIVALLPRKGPLQ
jgi:hypothetical protein